MSQNESRPTGDGPRMSVVMAVYNGGPYLGPAVESVLAQTYTDFELVAINDGSTDGSGDVLDAFARRDGRVRVLHQDNRGLIASLNRGVAEARGMLIARMDADDLCLPDRLTRQVRFLDAHPDVGIVGGIARYVGPDGENLGGHWPSWSPPALNGWRMLFETVLCHPTVVIRRDVLDRVGEYDAEAIHAEDYELWTRALFETAIANVPDVVLERRKWDGTIGALHPERQERSVVLAMQAAHERLVGRPVPEPVVARLRTLATRRPSASPVANERAAAQHLIDAYQAYTERLGSRPAEVEDHLLKLLLALRRSGGAGRIAPVLRALRWTPGALARHLRRRLRA